MQKLLNPLVLPTLINPFRMPYLFIPIINRFQQISLDQMFIDIQFEILIQQSIVNLCRDTHEADCLVSDLPDDGFAL